MRNVRFVGLDVHAATMTIAVAESAGEVRDFGTIANRPEAVRRLVRTLGPVDELRVCYEAGPTGYGLYWQLLGLGVHCDVVAPSLVPVKAGDRVKTDRRDALKLARCYRAGDLTPVWVPDAEHEALRDLVRVLATTRTGTLEKELGAAARSGYRLVRGSAVAKAVPVSAFLPVGRAEEIFVLMERDEAQSERFEYRLAATTRTRTLAREVGEAQTEGFELADLVSRDEHILIMERRVGASPVSP